MALDSKYILVLLIKMYCKTQASVSDILQQKLNVAYFDALHYRFSLLEIMRIFSFLEKSETIFMYAPTELAHTALIDYYIYYVVAIAKSCKLKRIQFSEI